MQQRNIISRWSFARGATVLYRVGVDVPMNGGVVDTAEQFRIERIMPTLDALLARGARVIVVGKRGRPKGKRSPALFMKPIARALAAACVARGIAPGADAWNPKLPTALAALSPVYPVVRGRVVMLNNVRFHPGEQKNSVVLGRALASIADYYVNDAFSESHRAHASICAVTRFLPAASGLLMEEEINELSALMRRPKQPFVLAFGGAKIGTKIDVAVKFLPRVDRLLLAGGMANTVLMAHGSAVGESLVDTSKLRIAKQFRQDNPRIVLPTDVVIRNGKHICTKVVDAMERADAIMDIGPETATAFSAAIAHAGTVVWNGPLGAFEDNRFAGGTAAFVRALLKSTARRVVIGGGETVAAFAQYKGTKRTPAHIFLSTGGGAMLEYLLAGTLPGIDALLRNK